MDQRVPTVDHTTVWQGQMCFEIMSLAKRRHNKI